MCEITIESRENRVIDPPCGEKKAEKWRYLEKQLQFLVTSYKSVYSSERRKIF